jgi:uncharacterized protein YbjT (DUF2867 family)
VINSGISYTFIRPNNFYSNFAMFFADSIKKAGTFYAPHGDGKVSETIQQLTKTKQEKPSQKKKKLIHAQVSYVDPADIGEAIATVLTTSGHAGKAYVITGPEAITAHQAAAELSKQLSRKVLLLCNY